MPRLTSIVCAIAALTAAVHAQLTPPPGPVEPTMKTLDEIEPSIPIGPETTPGGQTAMYVISEPGRYHLTGPIVADPGKDGLLIGQGNVSIDMRGFTISCAANEDGVKANGSGRVKIANGFFDGQTGSTAVNFGAAYGHVVEDIHVWFGDRGIRAAGGSLVRNCFVFRTSGTAIWGSTGTVIDGCRVIGSSSSTTYGIYVAEGGLIKECTVSTCSIYGIYSDGARVVDSTARRCVGAGFYATQGSVLTGCIAADNDGHGFIGTSAIRFTGCTAERNGLDGFRVNEHCQLRDNVASHNGQIDNLASGIRTTGQGNRLDGNTCVANAGYGAWVNTKYNVIVNNLGAGNGHANISVPEPENFWGGANFVGAVPQRANGNFNAP